jgi:diguanylate cyclase (GGDEF)-like protein
LKAGLHPAVDMILNIKNQIASQFDSIIQMIPIHTRNEKLGVLMVDNLLSQEEISEETITLLKMVSIQIGLALKNARLYKKVEELSVMDSLTGLYVQRHFHQRIREELSRAHRHHTPVSLVMLDIDHFKIINDTYGHPAGDRVMKVMSSKITSSIRKFDVAVRYGGDEFIVLMPGSNETETLRTAERIRKFVNHSSVRLETGKDIHFSCSIGVASFPEHANTDEELIQKADQALYEAKKLGRNRVVAYTKQPKLFPPNP